MRCPQCDTAVHVPEQDGDGPPPLPSDFGSRESDAPATKSETPATQASGVAVATSVDASPGDAPMAATEIRSAPALLVEDEPTDEDKLDLDDDEDDPLAEFKSGMREEEDLDMTPMVDVTFLLLIFFMVTAAFSLQKSIQMPRQQTDAPSVTTEVKEEDELQLVEVQIDEFGSFLVMAPDWEEETPGKQNLITALKRAIDGSDGMRLIIKVHEMCKLQFLVDAMDAGTIAGFNETQVTQVEGFD